MPLLSGSYPSVRTPKICQLCNIKKINTMECQNFSSICKECYNEQKTALEKSKPSAKGIGSFTVWFCLLFLFCLDHICFEFVLLNIRLVGN